MDGGVGSQWGRKDIEELLLFCTMVRYSNYCMKVSKEIFIKKEIEE
jgi:hypothetical protein